jgi:integrase
MRKPSSRRPAPRQRRSQREAQREFQIGDYWLGTEAGRPFVYCYWYDSGTRKVRRQSTGLAELEDAKIWLAEFVLGDVPDEPMSPANVSIAAVRKLYLDYHVEPKVGKPIRSAAVAKRAFRLVAEYMDKQEIAGAPKVADFGIARQDDFMRWCRDVHDLSAKSISTYLTYYKAGLKFAARSRVLTDNKGNKRELALLSSVPQVNDGQAHVAKTTELPRSRPRDWIPTDEEMARYFDAIEEETLFRYSIMALNTWARPEAIVELNAKLQVNFAGRLIALNQIGRSQNNKVRPTIGLTDNLFGWLKVWNREWPIHKRNGEPIDKLDNRTLKKAAQRAGIFDWRKFTRYTFRHFMATRIRRVDGFPVSREERAAWMGHSDPEFRTTEGWYESLDPDFLIRPRLATDALIVKIASYCKIRDLLPPAHLHTSGLVIVDTKTNRALAAGAENA